VINRGPAFHHAVLGVLALAGAAAWIWRATGFNPLLLIRMAR